MVILEKYRNFLILNLIRKLFREFQNDHFEYTIKTEMF
ncbi:hypothetical protein LEP1GSC081_0015 [Leptospira kirschneri str. H1]|nr:hypothetical protein LEP1GSC081_0015 [Leptospira kirschneri str. H1]